MGTLKYKLAVPTFPIRCQISILGAADLTSVFGMETGVSLQLYPPETFTTIPNFKRHNPQISPWSSKCLLIEFLNQHNFTSNYKSDQNSRSISTGQLNTFPYLHTQPFNLVIFKGSY